MTSSMVMAMPSAANRSIILRILGIRVSRESRSIACNSISSPSKSSPRICTLMPSTVRVDISAPNTSDIGLRKAAIASLQPDVLSWSVIARVLIPADSALLTNSAGESVPSLAVVCVCRSIIITLRSLLGSA